MPFNENIPGFMPLVDLKTLELLAKNVPPEGVIVEVGSFKGRSSWALAKSCDPSVTVYCIDLWESPSMEEFMENVRDCPNIVPIKGESVTVPWPDDRKADLIFIDADHSSPYVDNDIECWIKRLKADGILSGHDFNPTVFPDVVRGVMRKSDELGIPFKLFDKGFIWAIELNPSLYRDQGWIPPQVVIESIIEVLNEEESDTQKKSN